MRKILLSIVIALCIYFTIYQGKPVSLYNYQEKPIINYPVTTPKDTIIDDTIFIEDNGNDTIYETDTLIEYEYVYDTVYVIDTIVEEMVETIDSTNYLLGLLNLPGCDSTCEKRIACKPIKTTHKTYKQYNRNKHLPLIFPGNRNSGKPKQNLYCSIGFGYLPGIKSQSAALYSNVQQTDFLRLPTHSFRYDTVDVYYQYNNNKLDTFYIVKQQRKTTYQLHTLQQTDTSANGSYHYDLSFIEYPVFIHSLFRWKQLALRLDFGCITRIYVNPTPYISDNKKPVKIPEPLRFEYALVCMPGIQTNTSKKFHFRLSPFYRFQWNTNNILTNQPDKWLQKNHYGIHFFLRYTIECNKHFKTSLIY